LDSGDRAPRKKPKRGKHLSDTSVKKKSKGQENLEKQQQTREHGTFFDELTCVPIPALWRLRILSMCGDLWIKSVSKAAALLLAD
jgi:hypothetical protein